MSCQLQLQKEKSYFIRAGPTHFLHEESETGDRRQEAVYSKNTAIKKQNDRLAFDAMKAKRRGNGLSIRRVVLISLLLGFAYNSFKFSLPRAGQYYSFLDETATRPPHTQRKAAVSLPAVMDMGDTYATLRNETSACLLVMDDNHFLIEWLAYHYHTALLRNLIVAVDPRSVTSPIEILERWNGKMNVTVWKNDFGYVTNSSEIEEAESWVRIKFANDNPSQELIRHRARQRLFYYHCMQEHKRNDRGLTLLLDTDEFVRINYDTVRHLRTNAYDISPMWEPGSVTTLIDQELKLQRQSNISKSSCIQIPRLRFGAIDSSKEFPPGPFDASTLATLRWQHHAASNNYRENRISKTIVDLQRVEWDQLHPVESIHRPLTHCSRRKLHIRPSDQLLIIHHYLGSWEQYSFRNDARKGNERSQNMYSKAAVLTDERSNDIVPWLAGFVRDVGLEEAQRLLSDVGKVL